MSGVHHFWGWLAPWVHDYGALTVMVVVTLESFGMPLPGESLIISASILAGRGQISLPWLILGAWVGAVVGDNIGYVLGRKLGRQLIVRYGARIGITHARLEKVEAVFARHDALAVCFARFFAVLRQLNGIVAGILGTRWWRFLTFNAIGGALWVLTWSLAAFYLGKDLKKIGELIDRVGIGALIVAAVVIVLAVGFFLWRRWAARKR